MLYLRCMWESLIKLLTIAADVPILDVFGSHKKASQGIHNIFSNNAKLHEKKNTISIPVKTEAYSETFQESDMQLFAKLVNDWKLLTIFAKSFCFVSSTGFWIWIRKIFHFSYFRSVQQKFGCVDSKLSQKTFAWYLYEIKLRISVTKISVLGRSYSKICLHSIQVIICWIIRVLMMVLKCSWEKQPRKYPEA